jgi:hypothetical protein
LKLPLTQGEKKKAVKKYIDKCLIAFYKALHRGL